jgi:hypothetical protein
MLSFQTGSGGTGLVLPDGDGRIHGKEGALISSCPVNIMVLKGIKQKGGSF